MGSRRARRKNADLVEPVAVAVQVAAEEGDAREIADLAARIGGRGRRDALVRGRGAAGRVDVAQTLLSDDGAAASWTSALSTSKSSERGYTWPTALSEA